MVSVIIPVYNVEKYLPMCLQSVQCQTYKDLEIILVDDGSRDKSGKICDDFAQRDNRFIVYHRDNHGVSSSRNFGLDKCHGEFVCFVDSDDSIHREMIELLLKEISKGEYDIAMVLEKNIYDDDCDRYVGKFDTYSIKNFDSDDLLKGIAYGKGLHKCMCYHTLGKLYRSEVIGDIRFDESFSLSEDMLFNLRIYQKGINTILVQKQLYYRTMTRTDSLSSHDDMSLLKNSRVFLKSLEYIPFHNDLYRSYVLDNIMRRITIFKAKNMKKPAMNAAIEEVEDVYKRIIDEYLHNYNIKSFRKSFWLLLYQHPTLFNLKKIFSMVNKLKYDAN